MQQITNTEFRIFTLLSYYQSKVGNVWDDEEWNEYVMEWTYKNFTSNDHKQLVIEHMELESHEMFGLVEEMYKRVEINIKNYLHDVRCGLEECNNFTVS